MTGGTARDAKPLGEITDIKLKTNETNKKPKQNSNLRERDAILHIQIIKTI